MFWNSTFLFHKQGHSGDVYHGLIADGYGQLSRHLFFDFIYGDCDVLDYSQKDKLDWVCKDADKANACTPAHKVSSEKTQKLDLHFQLFKEIIQEAIACFQNEQAVGIILLSKIMGTFLVPSH